MLAVSIGNVHGYVPVSPPLDFERLAQIAAQVDVPLVLHGATGIPRADIQYAIHMGIAKLNINTEVRTAFLRAIAGWECELDLSQTFARRVRIYSILCKRLWLLLKESLNR